MLEIPPHAMREQRNKLVRHMVELYLKLLQAGPDTSLAATVDDLVGLLLPPDMDDELSHFLTYGGGGECLGFAMGVVALRIGSELVQQDGQAHPPQHADTLSSGKARKKLKVAQVVALFPVEPLRPWLRYTPNGCLHFSPAAPYHLDMVWEPPNLAALRAMVTQLLTQGSCRFWLVMDKLDEAVDPPHTALPLLVERVWRDCEERWGSLEGAHPPAGWEDAPELAAHEQKARLRYLSALGARSAG